jgi:hypothetical protein
VATKMLSFLAEMTSLLSKVTYAPTKLKFSELYTCMADFSGIYKMNLKILAECYATLRIFIEKIVKKIAQKNVTKKNFRKTISEFFSYLYMDGSRQIAMQTTMPQSQRPYAMLKAPVPSITVVKQY